MAIEHTMRQQHTTWQDGAHAYTVIMPSAPHNTRDSALARSPRQPDETRLLMVQGLRLLAGVWDDATPTSQALRCMESLGMRAISLDDERAATPTPCERQARGDSGPYDIALALHTAATRDALRRRVWAARQALRPAGTLALATAVTTAVTTAPTMTTTDTHMDVGDTPTIGPALVADDAAPTLTLAVVRGTLVAEGFVARVFAWRAAPTLAELAPLGHTLPAPRRLLVIATLGDDAEPGRMQLRSA